MIAPIDNGACFACGPHNAQGLQLTFEPAGHDGARATITLAGHLQGYAGIAHGGIVMLLLDEVMAHAAGYAGAKVVTAAVAVRFRAPVLLGVPLTLSGRVVATRAKILKVDAAIHDAAGVLLVSGTGSFVRFGTLEPGRGNSAAFRAV